MANVCKWNMPTGQSNCSGVIINYPADDWIKRKALDAFIQGGPIFINSDLTQLMNKLKQEIMNMEPTRKSEPVSEAKEVIIKVRARDLFYQGGQSCGPCDEFAIVSLSRAKEIYASLGRQIKGIELTKPKVKKPVAKKRKK